MTMHNSAEEEEPFHHNWMRFAPRAEGTLLLGYFGGRAVSWFQIRRNGMTGGTLFRVSSCE
jgi:hypothetical protein